MRFLSLSFLTSLVLMLFAAAGAQAQEDTVTPAPDRGPDEGEGPFERLIIRGATLINGDGGMPSGPVDIVIKGNTIEAIESVGAPRTAIDEADRPGEATREIEAGGMYVLPGFVDNHTHTGGVPKAPMAEYVYKLWMAHGITTVRGVPFGPLEWSLKTVLAPWAYAASVVYHDSIWYPLFARSRMRQVLGSDWGRLFHNWERLTPDADGFPEVGKATAELRRTGLRAFLRSLGILATAMREAPELASRSRRAARPS